MGSAAVAWDEPRAILRTAIDDPVVSDWFSSVIDVVDVHPPVNSWPQVLDLVAASFTDDAYAATRRRDRKSAASWQALATDAQVAAWVDALLRDLWLNTEDDSQRCPPTSMRDCVLESSRRATRFREAGGRPSPYDDPQTEKGGHPPIYE